MTEPSKVPACCLLLAMAFGLGLQAAERESGESEFKDYKTTTMVLTGRLDQVALAITNAFANGAYHRKYLLTLWCDYVTEGQKIITKPVTNAWCLGVPDEGWLPLTLIPLGKKMVAYDMGFDIRAKAVSADRTSVSVTPTSSGTTEDRYELSMHLSRVLGGRYLPPVASEITNVFLRIERQLREIRAARTNALQPTPDTAPGYYLQFWTVMGEEQKHNRRNWDRMVRAWKELQESHNPQGGANGRQPGGSEINRTSAAAASRRSP